MSDARAPTVVHDPDPRRLTAALIAALRRALAAAPRGAPFTAPWLVVAPTGRLRDHLQWTATRELGATAGVEFLLHRDLAARALAAARTPAPRPLPTPWLRLLLAPRLAAAERASADARTSELARYLAAQPSALGPLLATFRDLRDSGASEAELAAVAPRLSATGAATLALFARYTELLAELAPLQFGDGASATRAAANVAPLPAALLLHYGAYELTGATRELIGRTLAACGGTFFVPTHGADRPSRALAAALELRGASDAAATNFPRPTRLVRSSAATPRDELRGALRQLLAWHHEEAIPFAEMALLVRTPGAYAELAVAEAALLDLPLDESFDRPLHEAPSAARLALALRHLRAPDDRVLARTVARHWPAEWPAAATLAEALATGAGCAARLAQLAALLPADDPAARALAAGAALADELAQLPAAAPLLRSGDAALELALALLDEAAPARRGGALQLLELHQARALPLRRAIWIGLNERLFPRQGNEDFFLCDRDRALLRDATGRPLALHSDASDDEQLLGATAIAAVGEELHLSCARSDGDRELARSPWLDALAPDAREQATSRHPLTQLVERHAATGLLTAVEAQLLALPPGGAPRCERTELLGADPSLLARAFARAAVTESASAESLDYDGDVGPLVLPIASPSRFERLGRCPLQHLFADVLSIREPPEEPTSGELTAALRGSLFHRALERLARAHFTPAPPRPPPLGHADRGAFEVALVEELAGHLDALLDTREFAGALAPVLRPLRVDCFSRELARFVLRDWERLAALGIVAADHEFAARVDVGAPDWPLWLQMRFDRIARAADGRERVGDFKSARRLAAKASMTGALRGSELQLVLYGRAREAAGATLAGLELYSLHPRATADADAEGDEWLEEFDLDALHEFAGELQATLETLDQLRTSGAFPLAGERGGERGPCGSCAYRLACRHAHGPTRARNAAAAGHRGWYALGHKGVRALRKGREAEGEA
ncbi:MAG: PD-(D/E)XK nuclease family protein [Planctomycetes bacterium]|nr:PD-(D/E)XK nuclease family protein [Planctomycetota bacterium]